MVYFLDLEDFQARLTQSSGWATFESTATRSYSVSATAEGRGAVALDVTLLENIRVNGDHSFSLTATAPALNDQEVCCVFLLSRILRFRSHILGTTRVAVAQFLLFFLRANRSTHHFWFKFG
jgi:hypothetical protein